MGLVLSSKTSNLDYSPTQGFPSNRDYLAPRPESPQRNQPSAKSTLSEINPQRNQPSAKSTTGVMLAMEFLHTTLSNVGIDLRGREITVAQQQLHHP